MAQDQNINKNFPDKCREIMNDNFGRTYRFNHVDSNGNCFYTMIAGMPKKKKKKKIINPCPSICIVGEDDNQPSGPTPPCTGMIQVLKSGAVGAPYTNTVFGQFGSAPYTYSVIAGSLPTGLVLNNATGLISGVPLVGALFIFTIQAIDSNGCIGTQQFSINILNS